MQNYGTRTSNIVNQQSPDEIGPQLTKAEREKREHQQNMRKWRSRMNVLMSEHNIDSLDVYRHVEKVTQSQIDIILWGTTKGRAKQVTLDRIEKAVHQACADKIKRKEQQVKEEANRIMRQEEIDKAKRSFYECAEEEIAAIQRLKGRRLTDLAIETIKDKNKLPLIQEPTTINGPFPCVNQVPFYVMSGPMYTFAVDEKEDDEERKYILPHIKCYNDIVMATGLDKKCVYYRLPNAFISAELFVECVVKFLSHIQAIPPDAIHDFRFMQKAVAHIKTLDDVYLRLPPVRNFSRMGSVVCERVNAKQTLDGIGLMAAQIKAEMNAVVDKYAVEESKDITDGN